MEGIDVKKILEGIHKELEGIREIIKDRHFIIFRHGDERVISLLRENQQTLTNFVSNYNSVVVCPEHQVPMSPTLIRDDNGTYKMCYCDNRGGHTICPKC